MPSFIILHDPSTSFSDPLTFSQQAWHPSTKIDLTPNKFGFQNISCTVSATLPPTPEILYEKEN